MNIFEIVFPKLCIGCGREGQYVCPTCSAKVIVPESICPMCCQPSLDGFTHYRCRKTKGMDRLIVGLSYKGLIQRCLKKVKYKNAWEILGYIFGKTKFSDLQNCLVIPVPMWGPKERERGFNQASIVAELLHKNVCINSKLIRGLERTRDTKPMYGLKKEERRKNIQLAFKIEKNLPLNLLTNKKVLLVDDVWTTGATMKECAKVLKKYGAKSVWGITLAR